MGGVLERFFQVGMVVMLLSIAMNLSAVAFGTILVGPASRGNDFTNRLTNPTTETDAATINQGGGIDIPNLQFRDYGRMVDQFYDVQPMMNALGRIFDSIDSSRSCEGVALGECDDPAESVSLFIKSLLFIFQVVGSVYLVISLWSVFKGGGKL